MASIPSTLKELIIDESWNDMLELGLPSLCPQIKNLTLKFAMTVEEDIVSTALTLFAQITQLKIEGVPNPSGVVMPSPSRFCGKLITSSTKLNKLLITGITLENNQVREIIELVRHHVSLSSLV